MLRRRRRWRWRPPPPAASKTTPTAPFQRRAVRRSLSSVSRDGGSSENLFRREFWLGTVDARLPALLRIALGLLVLFDLGDRAFDFHAFYTAEGIRPGPGEEMYQGLRWSLFHLVGAATGSRGAVLALFVAGFGLAAALAAGYRTRAASVATWVFVTSLQNR